MDQSIYVDTLNLSSCTVIQPFMEFHELANPVLTIQAYLHCLI